MCHETLPVPGFKDKLTFFSSSTYFVIAASNLLKCSAWWNSASLFYYNTFWFTMKEKVIAHVISLLYLTSWKACIPKWNRKWNITLLFHYPQLELRYHVTKQCWVDTGIPRWFIWVLHVLPRRRNIKYTISQENLEMDVNGVLSGKSCHAVVGLAYPTWNWRESPQKINKFFLLWIKPWSLCHVTAGFFFFLIKTVKKMFEILFSKYGNIFSFLKVCSSIKKSWFG